MLKKITIACSCLAIFCLFFGGMKADAKEKPVEGVWMMFDDFNNLEAQFRNDKWSEAGATLATMNNDYKKLVGALKTTVDANTIQKFSFLLASLEKKVEAKDAKAINKPYFLLQGLFVDIMSYYDYPIPPVLMIAARYVGEAKEALEKDDLRDAAEEMEEILSFNPHLADALKEKGVADPEGFIKKIGDTEKAARAGKKDDVAKILDELEGILAPFHNK